MELTANALQTVGTFRDLLFTDTAVPGNCSMMHREGSGLVTLRGVTNQCRARFRVSFGANVAIPTGGTVAPITVEISVNGEPLAETTMISTPAALEEFNNISRVLFLNVPSGCCTQISVKNTTDADIVFQNASLIVERVA